MFLETDFNKFGNILVTGAAGFVGCRLVQALLARGLTPRCIVRSKQRFFRLFPEFPDKAAVEGDLLDPVSLDGAFEGVELAYYLIHSMDSQSVFDTRRFVDRDRRAAENFVRAAEKEGVRRIVYLGGLGDVKDNLSRHLASRQEVARILHSGKPDLTVFRAANIIGAGGAPFEILRHLVERLPVLIAPRWIDTRCQPIDIRDAVNYLVGSIETPETAGEDFDIGGPDITSYREMMEIYAKVRGLRRIIIPFPYLPPRISAIWTALLTPVPTGVVVPLLEGLKNEVICRENRIRDVLPFPLTPIDSSICNALLEVRSGPGKLLSGRYCVLD
jgi:uncharacterized protein YbjT (DUF2867 family)